MRGSQPLPITYLITQQNKGNNMKKKPKLVVRKWAKKNVQAVLRHLRKNSSVMVDKLSTGLYEVRIKKSGRLIFVAMVGYNDYLVRMDPSIFKPVEVKPY